MNKSLLVALIGIAIGGITFGLLTPVTVILLENVNTHSWLIGVVTTINYISFVMFSSYAGRLIERTSIKLVLITGIALVLLGSLGHLFWENIPLLLVIRFVTGIGSTFIFVSTEVLINICSDETNRGRNIGLYAMLLSAGISVGTILITTVEIYDWLPFVIGGGLMSVMLLFELLMLKDVRADVEENSKYKMKLSEMPITALLASALFGIFEASIVVAVPLYALRNGFDTTEVSYFLTSFIAGGIILLYYLSKLSDKYSKYNLLIFVSIGMGILSLLPSLTFNLYLLLLIFFVIGGIVPAYYTIGLNYTIDVIDKRQIAQANGHYIMLYGIGTILGPMLGSMLVELDKVYGYWIFSSIICLCYFLYLVIKRNIMLKKV